MERCRDETQDEQLPLQLQGGADVKHARPEAVGAKQVQVKSDA